MLLLLTLSCGNVAFAGLATFLFLKHRSLKKKPQLKDDAKALLHELTREGSAALMIKVLDREGLMYFPSRWQG